MSKNECVKEAQKVCNDESSEKDCQSSLLYTHLSIEVFLNDIDQYSVSYCEARRENSQEYTCDRP